MASIPLKDKIMKRDYLVEFYYETDCQKSIVVKTIDEVRAISYAIDNLDLEGWTLNGPGFRIQVTHVCEK